ncbi:MAG: hypothetical protein WAU17_21665 [Nitrospirales bacterium]
MEKKPSQIVLICGIAACMLGLSDPPAFGQALAGFLWGENVGWISLSCENTASCAKVNFGVKKAGKGKLTGFAWGENIGWVNFAPSGGGGGVTLDPATGQLSGQVWSKNVGWIRLRGTPVPNYGVDVDGGKVVNGKFPPLGSGNVRTGFSQTPCAMAGPAGTFTIGAIFRNTSTDTISNPFFKVASLTGGNVLCNADKGPGGPGLPLQRADRRRRLRPDQGCGAGDPVADSGPGS